MRHLRRLALLLVFLGGCAIVQPVGRVEYLEDETKIWAGVRTENGTKFGILARTDDLGNLADDGPYAIGVWLSFGE